MIRQSARPSFRSRWSGRWQSVRGLGGVRIVAAAAGGLAVYAGFAPVSQWWMPMLGFALLGLATVGRGWKAGAGLGFVFGAALFFPLLSWTNIYVGNFPWFALCIAESLLVMPAVALVGPASRRLPVWPVWAAAAWVMGESLRAVFPFGGFPWADVAFTQPSGPLLPITAVTGEFGLSFAVALVGFGLAAGLHTLWGRYRPRRRRVASTARVGVPVRRLVGAGVVIVVPFAAGIVSRAAMLSPKGAPTSTVAMVQGNVPEPGLEFNARREAVLKMHGAETAKLAAAIDSGAAPQPDMVIWSENSSDIDPYRNPSAAAIINHAAQSVGVPMLIGAVVQSDTPGKVYNMGIVWDPVTGPGATYTKRHPVPFAEYVPYRSFFRFFSKEVDNVRADFQPGDKPGNLTVAGVPVGDVICFEVVEDGLVRDVVNGGAQMIVVQTNNATFGYTNETYQQQAMSRVRAVEFGREVLIVAISGVSAVISPDGTVDDTLPLFTAGYLTPTVPLMTGTTPATYLGAPVQWTLSAATPLAMIAFGLWGWRRRRRGTAVTDTTTAGDQPGTPAMAPRAGADRAPANV